MLPPDGAWVTEATTRSCSAAMDYHHYGSTKVASGKVSSMSIAVKRATIEMTRRDQISGGGRLFEIVTFMASPPELPDQVES